MVNDSTILIVDDQLSAREVLRGLLTGQGYQLFFASNGQEALAKAREVGPDLILLDVMMPGMTGIEVCRALRTDPRLAEAPIVMITALDDVQSRVEGLEAGADDYISKPFNGVELLARVQTTTRLNRYRRLLAARAKFEWAVEQARDGFLVLDEQDNIRYANPQARLYLSLNADHHTTGLGKFLEQIRKQYRCEPEAGWVTWPEPLSLTEQPVRYLVRPESTVANAFWLQVNSLRLPTVADGSLIVQLQDVTAQMALRRSVWEFESLVAHKLRTPLVSLMSSLELLEEESIRASLNATDIRLLEFAYYGAQRLNREVQDILDYISAPTLVQPGQGFNLTRLGPLVEQISAQLELPAVTISDQTGPHPAELALPEQAVELIFRELLENAKKYHPQQSPTVEILLSTVTLHETEHIRIQVSDDGLTLSPEQLAQVWTPYYQGEKYFTGEAPGMGLGLPAVALLVWGVGGTCRLTNREPGPGVMVEIVIPANQGGASSHG